VFELKVFADPVELCWSGAAVGLRPKERLLLCRLVFAPGMSAPGRDLAVDMRYRGSPDSAGTALRKQMSNLRGAVRAAAGERATGSLLATEPGNRGAIYRLNLDPASVDALRFSQLVAAGQRYAAVGLREEAMADFGAALALWQGSPLREAARWPFAQAVVARLREQRRVAQLGLAELRQTPGLRAR
jgi:hypothetical protein